MCGIAGVFDPSGKRQISKEQLQRMTNAIAHRGRDASGDFFTGGCALGHRRLAVIDLSGGAQPMLNESSEVALTFNGMIYNYQELRARLWTYGYKFHTDSDTEVLLRMFESRGADCVKQLDGFFAFAAYNERTETLTLARDPLGKKPLYYYLADDHMLYFASEIQAVIAGAGVKPRLCARATEDFFAYGFIPDPKTIYERVYKLPPGHVLDWKRGQDFPTPVPYHHFDFGGPPSVMSEDEAAEELEVLLRNSVRKRLIADVPTGVFLSGGTDSGGTVAFASALSDKPLITFTAGFPEKDADEREAAREVSKHFNTQHYECVITPPGEEIVDEIAAVYGEPFADASAVPTLLINRAAKEHVTVALSGDGGDELFFGYRRYPFFAKEEKVKSLFADSTRKKLFGFLAKNYPQPAFFPQFMRARATFESLASDRAGGYFRALTITDPEIRSNLFARSFSAELRGYGAEQAVSDLLEEYSRVSGPLKQVQAVDFRLWLAGRMLVKTDRASMAAGVEVRSPFLDLKITNFALSLPESFSISGGLQKKLLKRVLEPRLPPGHLNRKKQGFVFPLANLLRTELAARVEAVVNDPFLKRTGVFKHQTLKLAMREHFSGKADHSRFLWSLLMFESSLRQLNDI